MTPSKRFTLVSSLLPRHTANSGSGHADNGFPHFCNYRPISELNAWKKSWQNVTCLRQGLRVEQIISGTARPVRMLMRGPIFLITRDIRRQHCRGRQESPPRGDSYRVSPLAGRERRRPEIKRIKIPSRPCSGSLAPKQKSDDWGALITSCCCLP